MSKFQAIYENFMSRYQRGGFLVGDVFKFNDGFKSSESYKNLGQNIKDMLDQMIESGQHVRVVGIKDTISARYPANPDTSSLDVVLDLALDCGGGRYSHLVAVPCDIGQPDPTTPNLPPIPDVFKRPNNVNVKPEEVEDFDNLANKTDKGDGSLSDTERSLPQDNTAIPSDAATPSPAVASYTNYYMKGV